MPARPRLRLSSLRICRNLHQRSLLLVPRGPALRLRMAAKSHQDIAQDRAAKDRRVRCKAPQSNQPNQSTIFLALLHSQMHPTAAHHQHLKCPVILIYLRLGHHRSRLTLEQSDHLQLVPCPHNSSCRILRNSSFCSSSSRCSSRCMCSNRCNYSVRCWRRLLNHLFMNGLSRPRTRHPRPKHHVASQRRSAAEGHCHLSSQSTIFLRTSTRGPAQLSDANSSNY